MVPAKFDAGGGTQSLNAVYYMYVLFCYTFFPAISAHLLRWATKDICKLNFKQLTLYMQCCTKVDAIFKKQPFGSSMRGLKY